MCNSLLIRGIEPWHLVCRSCHYEGSSLEPNIQKHADGDNLDEYARERALEKLRKLNFRRIKAEINDLLNTDRSPTRPRMLDVGSAHGWFMQICEDKFDVMGIEPDQAIAIEASKNVGPIRHGFFPNVLQNGEKFEVIVFNDVLEHIPDIASALMACNKHLCDGGLIVINAPCRLGVIYRLTKLIGRLGSKRLFGRMWQFGLPSPHVHYLDRHSVSGLAKAAGFEIMRQRPLPSVIARGLYSRIRYTREVSAVMATLIASVMTLAIPALRFLPSDIEVWYLRKVDER